MSLITGVWLAALATLYAYISTQGVDAYHYNADELMHVGIARGANPAEVFRFSLFETHPPLGHILRHYWMEISAAPAFVRGQALAFGVPTVLLFYRLGKRLNGELTGMAAAALAAFGHAFVEVSYIARNYTMFLFFLTLAFDACLSWREKHGKRALAGYAFFGSCACLTHFTGIFSLAVLAAVEAFRLVREKAGGRALAGWLVANAVAATAMLAAWLANEKTGTGPYAAVARQNGSNLWPEALFYPKEAASSLLPFWGLDSWLPLACAAGLLLAGGAADRKLRAFLLYPAAALALGMALFGSGLYPMERGRHLLWLYPFITLALGWALGSLWMLTAQKFRRAAVCGGTCALLAAGLLSYNAQARFADASNYPIAEYPVTGEQWQAATDYLSALGPDFLIIARRADALLLDPPGQNPYSYMSDGAPLTAVMPYYKTRMLFDPTRAHPLHYASDLPLRMAAEAQAQGMLEGVNQIVFVNSVWTMTISRPMARLMLCPLFEKTVMTFPPHPAGRPFAAGDLFSAPLSLWIVSKQTFIDQFLSPYGSARQCLLSRPDLP